MSGTPLAAAQVTLARELGPRGSREPVGDADPAGPLAPTAAAVLAALPAWWERRAAAHGLTGRWLDLAQALDAAVPTGIAGVSSRSAESLPALLLASPEELGQAYASALDPGVRARHGRHYTPAALAEHLWVMMRKGLGHVRGSHKPLEGLLRDPACGAGALLLPPLREHLHAVARSEARVALAGLANVVEGIDLDPNAVWVANVVLAAEALPLLAAVPADRRRPLPALARVGDGLTVPARRARGVVMNPPYGRVRLSPEDRDRFAHVLYGHANLYSLFMSAGLDQLTEDGVLGALVPTSFTAGLYFSNLRAQLARVAPLREATFIAERGGVFAGVLQETCLAVFSKRKARRTNVASMNGHVVDVAKVKPPRGGAPWVLPRRSDDAHIAAAAAAMPSSLSSSGWRVSTGPLVWNRRRTDLHGDPGIGRVKVLWAADLDGGRLHLDPHRKQHRFIQFRDARDRSVLGLDTPAVVVQRTTAPEQQRRLVCVELTEGDLQAWGGLVVVENHVNVLRPQSDQEAPAISLSTLNAVLSTECMDRVVRCLSGSVALSAYELEALPLPDEGTLRMWEELRGEALEAAVTAAYRP
jgi:adenine-specific DNA-methyltransferase